MYKKYDIDLVEYGYNILIKYPEVEKYALASEIRKSMFETLRLILYANKNIRLNVINKIDAEISTQKFFVRFSYKNKYINIFIPAITFRKLLEAHKFSKYFEFKIYEPKERIIKTLKYRDRVVQT